ncbi:site-specific integrase [Microbacterium sp. NPDC078849]|uniref:tyrosine-type recombinase/integrase n=1 Tax=unclassified Microbacterium TaxID=2609290 RepID=UPI00345038CD
MPRPPLPLETWGKIRHELRNGKPAAITYYRDSSGQRQRMMRTGKTKTAAENNLKAAIRERIGVIDDDELLTPESPLRALAKQWYAEKAAAGLKPGTLRTYRVSLDGHIVPELGGVRLFEATVPRIDRYLKALTLSSGSGTATTARVVLKGMFALAVRHGAMKSNPVAATAAVSAKRTRPIAPDKAQVIGIRTRFYEWDNTLDGRGRPKITRLLEACDMLIGTGIRTGELLALKWDDVDLVDCTVTIRRTVAVDEEGKVFVQELPKTDDSARTLILPAAVVRMLSRRIRESEFVFPSTTGTFWQPSNFRARWREALKGTEYAGTTPRAFRKLVATTLQRALGSRAAGDQLGHASERTTEQHYIMPTRQGPATQVLDDLFSLQASESIESSQ